MASLLKIMKSTGTIAEKVKDYNDANRKVAILCNHKRTVAASFAGQMEKMQEKVWENFKVTSSTLTRIDQRPPIPTMAYQADDVRP